MTDYVIHAEWQPSNYRLLINSYGANKGFPDSCKGIVVVITQSDIQLTFSQLQTSMRNISDTEFSRSANQPNATPTDLVMITHLKSISKCWVFLYKKEHFIGDCRVKYCTHCKSLDTFGHMP